MFEDRFYKLGKWVVRHKYAVVVAWVILLVVMAPFALDFFGNVNYNFGNNIVPSNSQSNESATIMQEQFSSGRGSNLSELVIVVSGVNLNNSANQAMMLSMQDSIQKFYSGTGYGFEGFQSIYTTEKQILLSYAQNIKPLLNGTSALLNETNQNLFDQLIPAVNASASIEFGLPSTYLYAFSQVLKSSHNLSKAETAGFQNASYAASQDKTYSQLSPSYVQNFSNKFSAMITLSNAPHAVSIMNIAINATIDSPWIGIPYSVNSEFAFFLTSLNANESLQEFQTPSFQQSFNDRYSIGYTAAQLATNATVSQLLSTGLNISAYSFAYTAFNMTQVNSPQQLNSTTALLASYGVMSTLRDNPIVTYNSAYLSPFLSLLYGWKNPAGLVSYVLNNTGLNTLPILPTSYVLHQFVGYTFDSQIIVAIFSKNFAYSMVKQTGNILGDSLANVSGSHYYLAGNSAFSSQLSNEVVGGLITALVVGISLSILIVGLFFRSPISAVMPFAFFMMSAIIGMGVNGLLYRYVLNSSVSFITPTLLLILLLGLTSDYVVYIMARYRRELAKGNPDAVAESAKWAGHAVFTSGITVTLSYFVLWVSNVPLFNDAGLTNAIGISVTVLLAITLLTALMAITRSRLFWPTHPEKYKKATLEDRMHSVAVRVVRNKRKIIAALILISFAGTFLYAVTPTNMDIYNLLPASSGIAAIGAVNETFHGDFFDRGYVVLVMDSPVMVNKSGNYTYNTAELATITSVEQKIASDKNFSEVYGPTFPYGTYVNVSSLPASQKATYESKINSYLGKNTSYVVIYFQSASLAYLPSTSKQVQNLQPLIQSVDNGNSFKFYVGGLTQAFNDVYSAAVSAFDGMIPILALSIFVILLLQLGSVFTPLRLIFMVMAAVAVSLAMTFVLFFYVMHFQLIVFLPMFVFVTLLAVGLDYDIFMITRVREEISKGENTEQALIRSISESGGVIITLGAILFVTFSALAFGGIPILQEIGIGLALGVLFDTFVSWLFFVPVVMLYIKKYNWWPSKLPGD